MGVATKGTNPEISYVHKLFSIITEIELFVPSLEHGKLLFIIYFLCLAAPEYYYYIVQILVARCPNIFLNINLF